MIPEQRYYGQHQRIPFAMWVLLLLFGWGMPADSLAQEAAQQDEQAVEQTAQDATAEEPDSSAGEKEEKESAPTEEQEETDQSSEQEETDQSTEQGDDSEMSSEDATADEAAGSDVESPQEVEVEPPQEESKPEKPAATDKKNDKKAEQEKCIIGATATLLEKQSELLFRARVDSGAKSCSLHIEKMEIEDESEKMVDNIGKVARFQVKNGDNKRHWLESKIAGYVIIKTSDNKERRYKVPLTFRWKHMEKEVLVTLNNRQHMEYPLLLGRNFLRGDFLVDVELNSDD